MVFMSAPQNISINSSIADGTRNIPSCWFSLVRIVALSLRTFILNNRRTMMASTTTKTIFRQTALHKNFHKVSLRKKTYRGEASRSGVLGASAVRHITRVRPFRKSSRQRNHPLGSHGTKIILPQKVTEIKKNAERSRPMELDPRNPAELPI